MKIRWSPEAAEDLERIALRIREDNPEAARQIVKVVYDGIIGLKNFPNLGRLGRETGTCELIFAPLPYIAVYRVIGSVIEISRIWHGAQDWP
jgi:toxin ParE1/3/4